MQDMFLDWTSSSSNSLVPNRRQAISWTNDDLNNRGIYMYALFGLRVRRMVVTYWGEKRRKILFFQQMICLVCFGNFCTFGDGICTYSHLMTCSKWWWFVQVIAWYHVFNWSIRPSADCHRFVDYDDETHRNPFCAGFNALTYRNRDKMAAIFHTVFSNAFSWMKMY